MLEAHYRTGEYFGRALSRWDIPLIGVVPDSPMLGSPSMLDYEQIFKTEMMNEDISKRMQHYNHYVLVAMGLRRFLEKLRTEDHSRTLFVTHASRNDLVLGFVAQSAEKHMERWGKPWGAGLILARALSPSAAAAAVARRWQTRAALLASALFALLLLRPRCSRARCSDPLPPNSHCRTTRPASRPCTRRRSASWTRSGHSLPRCSTPRTRRLTP